MTDDEWWAGLDRELSHVLVGTSFAQLIVPITLAATALTVSLHFIR